MNSDSEDEEILSDIELTAEELAEAEASLAAKHAKSKSTGDIVVPIDETTETKKVCHIPYVSIQGRFPRFCHSTCLH